MRKLISAVAVVASFLTAMVVLASPAAAVVPLVCSGTSEADYHPGLTNSPQHVLVTGQESGTCPRLLLPTLTFTTFYSTPVDDATCTSLLAGASDSQTLHWNDGTTSTWQWTISYNISNGQMTFLSSGPIVDGKFEGAELTSAGTLLSESDFLKACEEETGVTNTRGPATWTFHLALNRW